MSRSIKQPKTKGFLDRVSQIRKHQKMVRALKQELLNDPYPDFYDEMFDAIPDAAGALQISCWLSTLRLSMYLPQKLLG